MSNTASPNHIIDFEIHTEDLAHAALGAQLTSKLAWLAVAIGVAFINAEKFLSLLDAKFPWPDAGYFVLVVVAQIFLLHSLLYFVTSALTIARPSWRNARVGQHRLTASPDVLIDETGRDKRECKWLAVSDITASNRSVSIRINGGENRIIPRRAFETNSQYRAFARMLSERVASSQGLQADRVGPQFSTGASTTKLAFFFVAFLTGVFVLESYVRHNMFKDYTEYAAYMNRWDKSQKVEDAAMEEASWIGSTGLSEETERDLPRVLRKALGELLIDEGSLKANELIYIGVFEEAGKSVHYWRLPIRYGKKLFATVSLRRDGEPMIKLDNTGPTLITI